jgi:hypothetical protein
MDDLTLRAAVRAALAFVVTLVIGTMAVFATERITGDEGDAPEPTSTANPSEPGASPSVSPADGTWLMWVPGGLPDGVGGFVTTVPVIRTATTATADIAWLVRSLDAAGTVIDAPPDPYRIPIDVTGVEPAFAGFVPEPARGAIDSLEPGEGLMSETAAAIRGLGEGATLEFDTGGTVVVAGVLPDDVAGGYELLVDRATGEDIGVTHERYVLFQVRPGSQPNPNVVAAQLLPYLPEDAPYYAVEVRDPGSITYRRANDRELPLMLLKRRFGEFAAQLEPVTGVLTIDPVWVQERIVLADVPVLGPVTCHRKALAELQTAMIRIEAEGSGPLIAQVGDCFEASAVPDDPDGILSARDFGAAIDLNLASNQPGETPSQPDSVIRPMVENGFGWGGKDAWPQGALFRFRRPPPVPVV